MSAFHYRAFKVEEDEETVTYRLYTDFVFEPDETIKVILLKTNLEVKNFDEIKDLPDFSFNYKPLNWLRAKCTEDKIIFKEKLQHLA